MKLSIIKRETEIEEQLNSEFKILEKSFKELPGNLNDETFHQIIKTDFLSQNFIDFMGNKKVDLIFTSPPYNANIDYGKTYNDNKSIEDYLSFLSKFIDNSDKILKNGKRFIINIRDVKVGKGKRYPILIHLYNELCTKRKYDYRGVHIWYKGREESSTAWGSWMSSKNPSIIDLFEYVFVFQKEGEYLNGKDNMEKDEFIESNLGIWKIRPVKKIFSKKKINIFKHPCPFPLELVVRIIKLYSNVNNTIFDPFGGIGSTTIGALMSGRNSIITEISKEYCDYAFEKIKLNNKNVNYIEL